MTPSRGDKRPRSLDHDKKVGAAKASVKMAIERYPWTTTTRTVVTTGSNFADARAKLELETVSSPVTSWGSSSRKCRRSARSQRGGVGKKRQKFLLLLDVVQLKRHTHTRKPHLTPKLAFGMSDRWENSRQQSD